MKKYVLFLLYFSCCIIKSSQPTVDILTIEKVLRADDMRAIEKLIHGDFSPVYAYKSLQEVRDSWGKVTIWKKEKDITLRKTEVDTYHHMVVHALKKIKARRDILKKELDIYEQNIVDTLENIDPECAISMEKLRNDYVFLQFCSWIINCFNNFFGFDKINDVTKLRNEKKQESLKKLELRRVKLNFNGSEFISTNNIDNTMDAYNILTSMKNRLEKSIEQYIEKCKKDECALLFSKQGIYLNKDCPYQDMPKEVIQAHIIPHLLSQDIKVSQRDVVLSAYWGDGQDSWWFETSPPAGRIYIDSKPIEIRGEISRVLYYAPALPTAIRKKGYGWSD